MGAVEKYCVISDVHFPHTHAPTWNAFKKFHAFYRPDVTVFLGDFIDLESMSSFAPTAKTKMPVIDEIAMFVKQASDLQKHTRRLVIVEGNHEHRWARRILEPLALQLAGCIGLTLKEQCKMQGLRGAEWYVENSRFDGFAIGHIKARHGHKQSGRFGGGKHLARAALEKTMGKSQIFGHHHQIQMVALGTHRGTEIAIANGHMEDDVEYVLEPGWARGFTVLEVDKQSGFAHPYPVIVEGGRFVFGGKVYDGNRKDSA